MTWWTFKPNNEVHQLIRQATPIFICWNVWKNRCFSKYGWKKSSVSRVKFFIIKDLYMLITTVYPYISWPDNWKELVTTIENYKHEMRVINVS